jgi:hypothetical protein
MKFATTRPYANPEAAARKLIEPANSVEAVQDGRIHIGADQRNYGDSALNLGADKLRDRQTDS